MVCFMILCRNRDELRCALCTRLCILCKYHRKREAVEGTQLYTGNNMY